MIGAVRDRLAVPDGWAGRALATLSVAFVLGASLSVLYHVTDVVGDPQALVAVVLVALLASTLLGRLVRPAVALVFALVILVGGGTWYFLSLPDGIAALQSADLLLRDALALLSGLSVLRITNAGQWALAVAPAPVFLTWYLFVRRRYVGSVIVGGAFLGLFVLTGDASTTTTLFGVVGAAGVVGFGELDRRVGGLAGAEAVGVLLAAMVVATLTIGVVPTGAQRTLAPGSGGGSDTVEQSLTSVDDRVRIQGAISLSPEVRFTVQSDAPSYWKVASYDRYAGGEWLRTGGTRAYEGRRLRAPPGETRRVDQTFRVESDVQTMPAAWRPVEVTTTNGAAAARVTDHGSFVPASTLSSGDQYSVESRVLVERPERLRAAGTDYPDYVRERYLQVPESTPDRVAERTARITANAETPYDTARVVEQWLANNRRYSLDVERPTGDVADAFLFEMDAGYCTYYATTMVVMLRTQGIPARFVTGYTTGQQVDANRWVVRGLNSHAWVEVYFPGEGWVRFDPTPAGPRQQVEQARLQDARASDEANVDTSETEPTATPASTADQQSSPTPTPTRGTITANVSDPFGPAVPTRDAGGPSLPTREETGLGLIVALGVVAGLHRSGVAGRVYRELWLRRPPDGPPPARVAGAYERAEYLLARRTRERAPGETVRQYLASIEADEPARRLGTLYERAVYGGDADERDAAEAMDALAELRRERPMRERFGR
ncbi:MAG: DUF3488 and DUF4129 domain-containing transglutaminase family protein [Haloarculaceae archaeon]